MKVATLTHMLNIAQGDFDAQPSADVDHAFVCAAGYNLAEVTHITLAAMTKRQPFEQAPREAVEKHMALVEALERELEDASPE